jgi:23S rRNA (pseudouridine1915-N3)-methyltransferase
VKIRTVWLGRPSASPFEQQVESYRKQIHRKWPAEDRPLRPVQGGRASDPARILRLEAEAITRHHEPGWQLVALDENGRMRNSEDFADWLVGLEERGTEGILFTIGSDLGLAKELLERASERLSLGPMTLPHMLVRVLLWEQLFRATHILGGGAYHRVSVQ